MHARQAISLDDGFFSLFLLLIFNGRLMRRETRILNRSSPNF